MPVCAAVRSPRALGLPFRKPSAGIGDEWQVAVRESGLRPVFEFRLESSGGSSAREAIDAAIRDRLAARYPPLWAKTQQRLCDIAVCLLPSGSLRTGRKIRRLVDERR